MTDNSYKVMSYVGIAGAVDIPTNKQIIEYVEKSETRLVLDTTTRQIRLERG